MALRTILVNASFAASLVEFRGALLRTLVEAGHRVHASAPGLTSKIAEQLLDLGVVAHNVPLARTGTNLRADLHYRASLLHLIRKTNADLVLNYTIKPCIWGAFAARSAGVESVSLITGLGYAFIANSGLRHRLISMVAKRLWRSATSANKTVIFQNPDDRDDFIAAGALKDTSKSRLGDGSGVDMRQYRRAALPQAPRFLMVSRLIGNKGVREFGEAATKLLAEGNSASFTLAGYFDEGPDGIDPLDLDRWRSAGLNYIGALDNVRPALADCSIFVLPSYREGTPRSVLEAMATGRPIITSDAPGCRETVVHNVSGMLVPPRDTLALADAMRRLARDSSLRTEMADAAWRRCASKYAVEKVNHSMFRHLGLDVKAESS